MTQFWGVAKQPGGPAGEPAGEPREFGAGFALVSLSKKGPYFRALDGAGDGG